VSASDPEGNPIILTAENAQPGFPLPDFVTFTDNGDGTGLFRFEPTAGDRGEYAMTLLAADDGDGGGQWAELENAFTFVVTVEAENEPPVFDYIQRIGGVAEDEMYRAFNMGIGMVVMVGGDDAAAFEAHLDGLGESHYRIGEIVKGGGKVRYV